MPEAFWLSGLPDVVLTYRTKYGRQPASCRQGLPSVILIGGDSTKPSARFTRIGLFTFSQIQVMLDLLQSKKPSQFLLRRLCVVGAAGFEPAAPWSQTRYATGLRYAPKLFCLYFDWRLTPSWFCDPAGTRTPNRQLRRLMLYPVELPDQTTPIGFVWQAITTPNESVW